MSIETHKRKKLFQGLDKGYSREPEQLEIEILWDRLQEEFIELKDIMPKIIDYYRNPQITDDLSLPRKAKDEIADVSNFCDFIFDWVLITLNGVRYDDIYEVREYE